MKAHQSNLPWRLNLNLFLIVLLSITISACTFSATNADEDLYVPPTLAPHSNPVPTDTPVPVLPTATPACENNLSFLNDVTVLDGTQYKSGDEIEKIWLVRNSGTCNWGAGYELRLNSGEALGVETAQVLFPAHASSEVELRIVFTAPADVGSYKSYWQAYDQYGAPFGIDFYIEIVITSD
jgi:hypothetical protein